VDRQDADYFVGLVVLLGPKDDRWIILDGQQRLATTTMIYSAMRNWLSSRSLEQDSLQINSEFISVRMLGGGYQPRFLPNLANRQIFIETIMDKCPDAEIRLRADNTSKYSSNRLLLDGNLTIRERLQSYVSNGYNSMEEQTRRLFGLANYLETRVRVVALDVSSEANAFMIFESLNARGNDLAVADLVKNYVISKAKADNVPKVQEEWRRLSESLEERNIDDFLKVYWTAEFGRVQKTQLYQKVKDRYMDASAAEALVYQLSDKTDAFIALDDPGHDVWQRYGTKCREHVRALCTLGSKQVRAPILSAIGKLGPEEMQLLLWALVVAVVRHQTVGRRRTGLLELFCANLANGIWLGKVKSEGDILDFVNSFLPKDEEFERDFLEFSESKRSRIVYFLGELENLSRNRRAMERVEIDGVNFEVADLYSKDELAEMFLRASPLDKREQNEFDESFERLGNKVLVRKGAISHSSSVLNPSDLVLTGDAIRCKDISNEQAPHIIAERQRILSKLAVEIWTLPH